MISNKFFKKIEDFINISFDQKFNMIIDAIILELHRFAVNEKVIENILKVFYVSYYFFNLQRSEKKLENAIQRISLINNLIETGNEKIIIKELDEFFIQPSFAPYFMLNLITESDLSSCKESSFGKFDILKRILEYYAQKEVNKTENSNKE